MTTFWIYFSNKSKKFACDGLLNKTLIPRNLELLSVRSNWPCKTSPWWQVPRKAVKILDYTEIFLKTFVLKRTKTLNILEYTGEKIGVLEFCSIYWKIYWIILEFFWRKPVALFLVWTQILWKKWGEISYIRYLGNEA